MAIGVVMRTHQSRRTTPQRRETDTRGTLGTAWQRRASTRQRNVGEPAEPVSANREHDRVAGDPAGASVSISDQELAMATERFEARPQIVCGNPGSQVAPGRLTRRTVAP